MNKKYNLYQCFLIPNNQPEIKLGAVMAKSERGAKEEIRKLYKIKSKDIMVEFIR